MSLRKFRGLTEWALMLALICGGGLIAQAQQDTAQQDNQDNNDGGRVVRIGKADADTERPNLPPAGVPGRPAQPPMEYWVGLRGGDIPADHPLRAQLDLPENEGLLVVDVVPDSPAAKAGIKKHDILLKANKTDLHQMKDLVELVKTEGPKKGQITLELLRHNKRESVYLTPEKAPADVAAAPGQPRGGVGAGFGEFAPGMPDDLMQEFRGRFPMAFRDFGPGVIVGGGGEAIGSLPNGVSISVHKEGDKPAKVTVNRGEETWTVTGDDPEALKQLPDDLRPAVEQMLHRGGARIHVPRLPQQLGRGSDLESGGLQERLDRMEKRLEEMQNRLQERAKAPADKSQDNNNQSK